MNSKRLSTWLTALALYVVNANAQPYALNCETLDNPLGINTCSPHFSWKNQGIRQQTAFQLQVATDSVRLARGKADRWDSGAISSEQQIAVAYGGTPLKPRELCFWRIRAFDENGDPTPWSAISRFSIGLDETTLQGSYLMSPTTGDSLTASFFRKQITLKRKQRTLIHINTLGYHELHVNGQRIGRRVLTPVMTQLDQRSAIVTYDITDAVHKGMNDIVITASQGWYKPVYFKTQQAGPVVKAEVDVYDKSGCHIIAATDASWLTAPSGYSGHGTWRPWEFGGERLDARRQPADMTAASLDRLTWAGAKVVDIRHTKATPEMFAGNHIARHIQPKSITQQADGKWFVDMGTCLSGWFSMRFHHLREGQTVKIEYFDNIEDGKPIGQDEYDEYIACGKDGELFCNHFHTHAYQYVVISGLDSQPQREDIEGLLLTSTEEPQTSFHCSDSDLNAIHDMIQYTMRCLTFSGYMVDCPHIERMGYGGDGNSSTQALQTMFDVAPTFYNWVRAWDDVQDPDGSLPHVAPAGIRCGGGPYWCAFIIKAPWRTYWNYGDTRLLQEHYDAMKKWLEYVKKYSPEGVLKPWPNTHNRYWYLGDWLAPDGIDVGDERSVTFVNNAYICECLGNLSDISKMLGHKDDSQYYRQWQETLRHRLVDDYWHAADSTFASGSPLDLSIAVMSGIATGQMAEAVNEKLAHLSRTRYKSHIAVGLVGVPIFTEWATRHRQTELMYDILKQPDYPGYLYMVRSGATTTWESWDHRRSSIHNCYNGIGTWFYEALGGITALEPAYKHVDISPQYPTALDSVEVNKETPYGTISVAWKRTDAQFAAITLDVTLPPGVTANVEGRRIGTGHHRFNIDTKKH